VHLLVHEGHDAAALERLVDHQSGLLRVSGVTSDMTVLLEPRATEPHVAEAVDLMIAPHGRAARAVGDIAQCPTYLLVGCCDAKRPRLWLVTSGDASTRRPADDAALG